MKKPKKTIKKTAKKTPKKNPLKIIIPIGIVLVAIIAFVVAFQSDDSSIESLFKSSQTLTLQAQEIIDGCTDDVHCAVEELDKIRLSGDAENIMPLFVELINLYDAQVPCHETGHHLGLWLYGYVGDLEDSLQYAQQKCGGAIYHGVIQNHMMTLQFYDTDPDSVKISDICQEYDNPYDIERWQCIHGLGHGLTTLYEYDIFSALERCEDFEPGWEQISCSKGILMQNVVKIHESKGEDGTYDADDVFYPCNQLDEKYMPQCYHYHVTHALIQNEGKVKKTYDDYCDKISPPEIIPYCYYGMGRQLSANIEGKIENAIFLCTMGERSEFHSDCFKGMMMTLVNGNDDPKLGFIFCSNIPEQFKEDCYDGLGQWITMLSSSMAERIQMCSNAENDHYQNICTNAGLKGISHL